MQIQRAALPLLVGLLSIAPQVQGQEPGGRAPDPVQKLIQEMAPGARVVDRFDGPPGLTGYIIQGQGKPTLVWVTEDQRHLIAGNVFDRWGRNVTQVAAEAHQVQHPVQALLDSAAAPASDAKTESPSESRSSRAPSNSQNAPTSTGNGNTDLRERMKDAPDDGFNVNDPKIVSQAVAGVRALRQEARVIREKDGGQDAPRISVYIDPNCGPCRDLIRTIDKARLGDAALDWIPVSLTGSDNRALAILETGTPESIRKAIGPGGGQTLGGEPSDLTRKHLQAHNLILKDTLIGATPIAVIQYPDQTATVMVGVSQEKLTQAVENPPAILDTDR